MKYCVSEIQYDENLKNNAAVKARDDVTRILSHMGMKRITLSDMKRDTPNHLRKLAEHVKIAARWKRAFGKLQEGDILYIQFPPVLHTVFYAQCVKSLQKRGVKVVLLIHDLEILRWKKKKNATFAEKLRFDIEEKTVLLAADGIIAHNEKMKVLLTELGIDSKKIVCLDIFDYLIPDFRKRNAFIKHVEDAFVIENRRVNRDNKTGNNCYRNDDKNGNYNRAVGFLFDCRRLNWRGVLHRLSVAVVCLSLLRRNGILRLLSKGCSANRA